MSAKAIQKGIRQSARKMRLVVDTVRGRDVNEAYAILKFSKKKAAKQIEKVLRSAVANAEHNEEMDVDNLVIKSAYVDEGPTMRRFMPRAMGRATIIRKRTSHITVVVAQK